MKNLDKIITYTMIMMLPWLLACCGEEKNKSHDHHQEEVYTCSMHPEIRQNEKGRCPICGMDLIPVNKEEVHHNHNHGVEYTCPMHPDVKKNEKGRCPHCGMNLVPVEDTSKKKENTKEGSHEVIYTCSMHPEIKQNEQGRCPICGMDLIPTTNNSDNVSQELKMSEQSMKLANVKTTTVKKGVLKKNIRMNGKVHINEQNKYIQTSHIPGRIEKLVMNYKGMYVKKGLVIAYIYSPALSTAQQELLETQEIKDNYPDLYQASINKLKNWKVSNSQIESILKTRKIMENFPILADKSGYVTKKFVNYGEHVMEGQSLYEVTDYSSVWAIFDIYETDYHSVSIGDTINFTVNALPGKVFSGMVTYIDPFIDPKKRTSQVRIVINNVNNVLLPEMLIIGNLETDSLGDKEVILVPKSAVLWTGKTAVVFVKSNNPDYNLFSKREVLLGDSNDNEYAIKEGLEVGEVVVSNGVFSVDASAQLAGKSSMMD